MRHLAWLAYELIVDGCDCGGVHLAVLCPCGCRRPREVVIPTSDIEQHDVAGRRMLVWGTEVEPDAAPEGPNRAARRAQRDG